MSSHDVRDVLALLRAETTHQLSAWCAPERTLIGWGEAFRVDLTGPDQAARASGVWQALAAAAEVEGEAGVCAPLTFGSFGFFPSTPGVLIVPATVYVAEAGRAWVVEQAVAGSEPSPLPEVTRPAESPGKATRHPGTHSDATYLQILRDLIATLRRGEARKVVLARDVHVDTAKPVPPGWLAAELYSAYPTCWTYAVDGLVGATPEMLAEVTDRGLFTRVLAGTAGRDGGDALARSPKDLREHALAVESVRRALEPLCDPLEIPEQPQILTLPNVTHLSTEVRGRARVTSLQAAAALHPTAAVCGTPTDEAARIIQEVEGMDRGRYAAPVGWMDARGNGQWGIALRCGQVERTRVRVLAGGGIMPDSDPARELAETEAKMVPVLAALGATTTGTERVG